MFAKIYKQIQEFLTNNKMVTHIVTDTTSIDGRKHLMGFLKELELRNNTTAQGDRNTRYFGALSTTLRDQLLLAATNWPAFCEQYHCKITYRGTDLQKSNDFKFYIREKTVSAPRDWEMKFIKFSFGQN